MCVCVRACVCVCAEEHTQLHVLFCVTFRFYFFFHVIPNVSQLFVVVFLNTLPHLLLCNFPFHHSTGY